jgi:hypothetical protein
VKINPVLIILVAALGLALSAGLAVLSIQLDSLPPTSLLIVVLVSFGIVILFSLLLRSETRKSERLVRQALENLGFERENWISRQYRGVVDGREYEILPFFTKGYGNVLALQILLRGVFNSHLVIALPRGLSEFVVWEAELGSQIAPAGYAGLQIYTADRINANARLGQPEMQRLVMELFNVPSQTPLVLEIAPGVIRFRLGRFDLHPFDEAALRRWLRVLSEIGNTIGNSQLLPAAGLDETFAPDTFRRNSRWWVLVALFSALLIFSVLMFGLLFFLK